MKLDMVKVHMQYLTVHLYRSQLAATKFGDERIRPLMEDFCRIYAIRSLKENCGSVY